MAIDGIGGVGALNVSSTMSPVRRTEPAVKEQAVTTVGGENGTQIQITDLPPVSAKSNSNNEQKNGKENGKNGTDDASLQYEGDISKERIQSAVEDLNKQVKQQMHNTKLSFQYHDETNRISITVTDSDTDEVIREIPAEKALDMLAKAWEMAGLLVDEKR